MRKIICLALCLSSITAVWAEKGPYGGENIIANGTFEDSIVPNLVNYGDKVSSASWVIGSSAGLSISGSWCSPEWMHFSGGNCCAFIKNATENSYICTTFSITRVGLYRLSFYHAASPGSSLGLRLRVLVDGEDRGYVTNWSMDFDVGIFDVPLSIGEHTLEFRGDSATGDQVALIDNVTLEIPSDYKHGLANIDNFGFRFDNARVLSVNSHRFMTSFQSSFTSR